MTKLGAQNLDNVIVLRGLPSDDPMYTKVWIRNKIFELLQKHKARVLEPAYDVTFVSDSVDPATFNAVIILDGFSHMRLADDGETSHSEETRKKHKIELLFVDSEDEGADANPEEEAKKEAERKKREEEEKVTEYSCFACTMINPISMSNCDCCGTAAPPMEEIKAAHLAKLNEERKARGEVVED